MLFASLLAVLLLTGQVDAVKLTRVRRLAKSGAARVIHETAGLSRDEAARHAGVHPLTIYRWETGSRRPHGEAALRYLALLEDLT